MILCKQWKICSSLATVVHDILTLYVQLAVHWKCWDTSCQDFVMDGGKSALCSMKKLLGKFICVLWDANREGTRPVYWAWMTEWWNRWNLEEDVAVGLQFIWRPSTWPAVKYLLLESCACILHLNARKQLKKLVHLRLPGKLSVGMDFKWGTVNVKYDTIALE